VLRTLCPRAHRGLLPTEICAAEVLLPFSTSNTSAGAAQNQYNSAGSAFPRRGKPPLCLTGFLSSDHAFSCSGQDPEASEADGRIPTDYKGLWIQTFPTTLQLSNSELHGMKPVVDGYYSEELTKTLWEGTVPCAIPLTGKDMCTQ